MFPGVWMCCAKNSKLLILFTDIAIMNIMQSYNFIRFAVIVSDVLVVHCNRVLHVKTPDLLRTIFTAHLRVFGLDSSEATRRLLLLFAGYSLQSPAAIEARLFTQARQVWQHVTASQRIQPQFLDYFDFNVMSHSVQIRPEGFRLHFTDRNHPNYLFKPQYHKNIPIDNLACLMESSWVRLFEPTWLIYH
ncbi:hypothetical protein M378DRAFT_670741 [Amanita muscaria Koide BX008]|uniref:Uncharacterized protein n=1 Tax=Amanita muscaria (strain Koide BX008) TaxID=946122 RepID=A0A0C2X2P7_AMAMK|nr:hypothetical protein M378DRAFT_670741 [Amanita muscaria Koide BX008]